MREESKVRGCYTLRASFFGTFLQTLPDLIAPLKGHSLSPRSCPAMRSAPSERFGYWSHSEHRFPASSSKLQALVYDILPSTTAVFSYAIGSRKLSANEQFFCWCSNCSKFVANKSDYIRRLFYSWPCCLSPFLTGRMFVRRTYFGYFDKLWFVS